MATDLFPTSLPRRINGIEESQLIIRLSIDAPKQKGTQWGVTLERIFPMIQQKEAAVIGGVIYISSSRVINPERVGVVIATCFELSWIFSLPRIEFFDFIVH